MGDLRGYLRVTLIKEVNGLSRSLSKASAPTPFRVKALDFRLHSP
jgi:hypothetical protein